MIKRLLCRLGIHNWEVYEEVYIDKYHMKRSFRHIRQQCVNDGCEADEFLEELKLKRQTK